ncbi:MAG: cyclic-di-AMP receptor [Clostridia bacterium]|nr:cyclic-di-AMP receptor [Clostridia bacterium]
MKLVIAIIQDEDANRLISEMMNDGYSVTKLATTGGFLRAGNTTLLAGVEDDRLDGCLHDIEKVCKSRRQMMASPMAAGGIAGMYAHMPIEVTVGGATVFVLDVEQFHKY